MAKGPGPKKAGAKAESAKADKFGEAMKALEEVEAIKQEFGRMNRDGTVNIDLEKLEELKQTLGKAAWSHVRFVALNAPFKRRSQIPPA